MAAKKHSMWEMADALRRIVTEMNVPRTYPRLVLTPFVGFSSVQLEISGGTAHERTQVAQTIQAHLQKRFADLEQCTQIRIEGDQVVLIVGGQQLRGTV